MRNIYLILIFNLLFTTTYIFCQDNPAEQISIALSNPQKSGTLIIRHYKGSIKVTGYKGIYVIIAAQLRHPQKQTKAEGLQKISASLIQLEATEKENTITVNTNSYEKTIDLTIQVPSNFSLDMQNHDSGNIEVAGLSGEMDISNRNGAINILNLNGSSVLNTIDGDIKVVFAQVTANTPMAFSTLEGTIDLSFPSKTAAHLKMKTDHGDIFSDFDIKLDKRAQLQEKSKNLSTNKVILDQWLYGNINGGGAEFLLKSFNGNIYIRKNSYGQAQKK